MPADRRRLLPVLALVLLAGCGVAPLRDGGPAQQVDLSHVSDAVPRSEPPSRHGNPASYTVDGKRYHVLATSKGYMERGIASWYGTKFHGRRTSNGEPYDMYGMTAAHRTLPLPTYVRVTNLANGRAVVVRVNDRGPFHSDRIIDLSYAAAGKLGLLGRGTAQVEVQAIDSEAPAARIAEAPTVEVQPAVFTANATVAEPVAAAALAPVVTTPSATSDGKPAPSAVVAAATDRPRPIYLQVGAFSERRNAEQLRERLVRAELDSAAVHAREDAIYRVRLGPFASPAEADALAGRLVELGLTAARVYLD